MKTMKRFMIMSLAFAMMLGAIHISFPEKTMGKAEATVVATPTSQVMEARSSDNSDIRNLQEKIPMYSIVQENGWGANYIKLRDIAYCIDFNVVWDASKPNEMRIYTNQHYLDPWKESGPATEEKIAVKSTMDIYIDDVKVDVDVYMIDNNNYFKIRDLAKAVNFGCIYNTQTGGIALCARYPYQDGDKLFTKENYPVERIINYEDIHYYDVSSGTLMDTPNIDEALSPKNPSARMNYVESYTTPEVQKKLGGANSVISIGVNRIAQTLADEKKIADNCTEEVTFTLSNGEKRTHMFNPYYRYSAGTGTTGTFPNYDDTSIAYKVKGVGTDSTFCMPTGIMNVKEDPFGTGNPHESLTGIRQDTAHILAKLDDFSSDREKIRYLGQQVCARMDYARKGMTLPGGIAALNDGSFWAGWPTDDVACGVCEHYVRAFERICVAAGYDYIRLRNATHSWDVVYLRDENKWVVVDCTFADGDGIYGTSTGNYDKYLCCELDDYDDTLQNEDFCGNIQAKTIIELADLIQDKGL